MHVLKKGQDKDRKAPVDASKVKEENLKAADEKCYKKISLRSLKITGLFIHLRLEETNKTAKSIVSQSEPSYRDLDLAYHRSYCHGGLRKPRYCLLQQ